MSDTKRGELSRRGFLWASVGTVLVSQLGCSSDESQGSQAGGTGGTGNAGSGGAGPADGSGEAAGGTGGYPGGDGATDGAGGSTEAEAGRQALVGIARGSSVHDAVNQAIALTPGLGFIKSGSTVLLKPNLNSGDPYPYSTNPEVVSAAIEIVKQLGAGRIIVADRSNPSFNTIDAMKKAGIYDVAQAAGVEIIDLGDNSQTFKQVQPAQATHWSGGFRVSSLVLDGVDHIINLAACKHHSMANFSMAIKAWMGIISQNDRNTAHQDLGNRLPELHLAKAASYTILDATKACLTKGPMPGGAQASPGLIVATSDPIACDVTGLAILKYSLSQQKIANAAIDNYTVWTQPQIQRAMQIGIGITSQSAYDAAASGVAEFDALMSYIR